MIIMNLGFVLTIVILTVIFLFALLMQQKKIRLLENLHDHAKNKLENLQVNFGHFVPQEVVEQLTDAEGHYKPIMRNVTVLFADLKGFTQMCDQLNPSEVVEILNGYFRIMSKAISENHGRVTELTGDGILALFGALGNNPWHIQDAVNGALAMRSALERYNIELREKSLPELYFGIGIIIFSILLIPPGISLLFFWQGRYNVPIVCSDFSRSFLCPYIPFKAV